MAIRYYYNSGEYSSNWVAGPTSTGGGLGFDYHVLPSSLRLDSSYINDEWATISTNTSFDLTNWSDLKAYYTYNAVAGGSGNPKAFFGISTSGTASYPDGFESYFSENDIPYGGPYTQLESLDISSYDGFYYLYFGLYGPAGGTSSTELEVEWVKVTGEPGDSGGDPDIGNSGTVGLYNTPLLNIFCDSICNLDASSGNLTKTFNNLTLNSLGYEPENPYGRFSGILGSITAESFSSIEILATGNHTLQNLGITSFAANTGSNFGSLNTLYPLGDIVSNSSGQATISYAGYFNSSLADISLGSTGVVPEESSYSFKYTKESKRFIGRSCQTLNIETVNNKIDESCFVMIKAHPVTIYPTNRDHEVCRCDCTVNLPIYLNRVHSQDVDLVFITKQGTQNISHEGETIIPSIVDEDYYHNSGEMSILSGNIYGNFPVDIINNITNLEDNYFVVELLHVVSRNICISNYSFNVIIRDCSDRCLYRWTYTIDSYWTGLGWELVTDNCSVGSTATPPSTDGEYVGEERFGTCSL